MIPEHPVPPAFQALSVALQGRYGLLGEIGQGGMAKVFLAEDLKHGRRVAIKVLHPEISSGMGADRFLREIRIAAGLQHPNILPMHDSGRADGLLYYVMPFVDGESLDQVLKKDIQLPVGEAIRLTTELAEALAYAHSEGIVHRDIKPENILISKGHAIVMDFGIATALTEAGEESLTRTGLSVGTPSYMSPEQAKADPNLDHRSDIYSLGCVLYEMLAGEPPFSGVSPQAVMSRHIQERPPSVSTVRPSVPPEVEAAIERALQKVPADRFATATDFSRALTSDLPVPAGPVRVRRGVGTTLLTITVALVAVVAIKQWILPGSDLDPNRVVAFPLTTTDPQAAERDLGWRVALAIGTAMEHAQPLRFIDGADWLSQELIADPRLMTPEEEKRIARDRRARYFTSGVVGSRADSIAVVLRLFDVLGDTLVQQETASGSTRETNAETLGLAAVSRLLPSILATGRDVDFSALTDRVPGAIALTIAGTQQYRNGRYGAAYDLYRRAVEEDTLMAFAAVMAAQAAGWINRYTEAEDLAAAALAHEELLPPKYRRFIRGWDHFLNGRADSASSYFRGALEIDPEWPEGLTALGEVYYHLLPSEAPLDSLSQVTFERSLDRDTIMGPALVHLAEIALRKGDVAKADPLIRRLESVEADRSWIRQLETMRACVQEGVNGFDWETLARDSPGVALLASRSLAVGGSQPECAEEGLRTVLASAEAQRSHWGALFTLQSTLLAQGRTQEVYALLDSAQTAGSRGVFSLYLSDAVAGWPLADKADEAREMARSAVGPGYPGIGSTNRWLLGMWAARSGMTEELREIIGGLSEVVDTATTPTARIALEALGGHLSFAEGDTAGAINTLKGLSSNVRPSVLTWDLVGHLAAEKLLLAELLLAEGRYREAWTVASIFDHPGPVLFLVFLPRSLEIRAQAAEALGREGPAREFRRRLATLGWTDRVPPGAR